MWDEANVKWGMFDERQVGREQVTPPSVGMAEPDSRAEGAAALGCQQAFYETLKL